MPSLETIVLRVVPIPGNRVNDGRNREENERPEREADQGYESRRHNDDQGEYAFDDAAPFDEWLDVQKSRFGDCKYSQRSEFEKHDGYLLIVHRRKSTANVYEMNKKIEGGERIAEKRKER